METPASHGAYVPALCSHHVRDRGRLTRLHQVLGVGMQAGVDLYFQALFPVTGPRLAVRARDASYRTLPPTEAWYARATVGGRRGRQPLNRMVVEYKPCNSAPGWGPRAPGWTPPPCAAVWLTSSRPRRDRIYGTRLPENGNLQAVKREKMFWNPGKSR